MASKPARYSRLYLVAGVALVVADSAARGKAPHAATLALSTAWLLASTMGVVAGYRRLWALREYDAHAAYRAVMACLAAAAMQGSALSWVRACKGTLLETAAAAEAAVAEVAKSRLVRWQERHYMWLSLGMGLALPLLIAGLGWGDWTGALSLTAARLALARYLTAASRVASLKGFHYACLQTLPTSWLVRALAAFGVTYDLRLRGAHAKAASKRRGAKGAGVRELCPGCDPRYWYIHGKPYDLSAYVDKHPGGRAFLLLGKGRDVTELVESVHAMTAENWRKVLLKYEVQGAPEAPRLGGGFDWELSGDNNASGDVFYAELKRRVRARFAARRTGGDKTGTLAAPWSYWAWQIPSLAFSLLCTYRWIATASALYAMAAGFMWGVTGFGLMHTASHGGLSHNQTLQHVAHMMWCNLFGVFNPMWLQHHVWGHHSYTGVVKADPDLTHGFPVFRKHREQSYWPIYRHQAWAAFVLLSVFPNQLMGQALIYMRGFATGKLFGMQVVPAVDGWRCMAGLIGFGAISIGCLAVLPMVLHGPLQALPSLLAYAFTIGGIYFGLVFPNHDMEHTPERRRDWGEQQVLNSGNFGLPAWFSQLVGCMNYQIEHHLFPGVHPAYYPEISQEVRKLCAERGLIYNYQPTWFAALQSYRRNLQTLSVPSGLESNAHKYVNKAK